jgi:CheY-like chemotaxis protein
VWLHCELVGEHTIRIEVGDTGIGIPRDQQQAIFNEFNQVDNPERDKAKGMGLGLAIVKRTAAMLGYRIEIDSMPDTGSRFSLCIPAAEQGRLPHQHEVTPEVIPNEKPLAVLVIDDDSLVRESMSTLLEEWGYSVYTAGSLSQAIAAITGVGFTPDVIVADYQLPGEGTGLDAIAAVRKTLKKKIPAMIITGDILPEHLREAEQSGFPLLHKPVAPAKIRAFFVRCQHDAIA